MSELFTPVDDHDHRLALTAEGLLGTFNRAGLVTAADVHVARATGLLAGEQDESVLLAVALTCRAVRAGSVCLELATVADVPLPDGQEALPWPELQAWTDAVAASPLVERGVLRWDGRLLYLDRYHEQETQVLEDLAARAASTPHHDAARMAASLARIFAGTTHDEQRAVSLRAAGQWTTVLTGGPGTGKTTTVAGLLVALREQYAARGEDMRVALTAPTGKAAARLQESMTSAAGTFDAAERAWLSALSAGTLHRLLRPDPGNSTRFRHHRGNRLPHDVVVVDETSMVSLTMMARLLEALRPDTRLVLVGDPDQLSSVEAGAVLGDLVRGYAGRADSPVAALTTTRRFGRAIGRLARALRDGDADEVLTVLSAGEDAVVWVPEEEATAAIRAAALPAALAVRDAAVSGRVDAALEALGRHRLLCAHREGPWGVHHWNRRIEQWLTAEVGDHAIGHDRAYVGRPLLVTANDHALGIWNGDTAVVVDHDGARRVVVDRGSGPLLLAPPRLGDVETMHAMTIHKSQGSQADEVTVLLPDEESRLLTRELLYTAVTRARHRVRVVGAESAVRSAVGRRAQRASGLARRLATH